MSVRDAAPPAAVSAAPAVAGFPAAIARAGLGAVDASGAAATVTFPGPGGVPPYAPFSTAPTTVSRSLWDQATSAARGAASDAGAAVRDRADGAGTAVRERAEDAGAAVRERVEDAGAAVRERAEDALSDAGAAVREHAGPAVDAVTSALPGAPRGGAGDPDKAFEELYDRLKRELLIEQEQLGQLFHEP